MTAILYCFTLKESRQNAVCSTYFTVRVCVGGVRVNPPGNRVVGFFFFFFGFCGRVIGHSSVARWRPFFFFIFFSLSLFLFIPLLSQSRLSAAPVPLYFLCEKPLTGSRQKHRRIHYRRCIMHMRLNSLNDSFEYITSDKYPYSVLLFAAVSRYPERTINKILICLDYAIAGLSNKRNYELLTRLSFNTNHIISTIR